MNTYTIEEMPNLADLVKMAHASDDPLVVYDGDDECLVAMRPAVFERILFEGEALNSQVRSTMHL